MTEEIQIDVPQEGENPFEEKEENETPSSSSDENNENGKEDPSPGGDKEKNTQDEDPYKDKPFHEHPRWKEREQEWEKRYNEQEKRHQDDLKAIREEFSAQRKKNAEQTLIPFWFGGDQEQWDAYRADRDKEIREAEERAYKRIEEAKLKENQAIEEATAYMESEIKSIENDTTLNPKGEKIDRNKLLKIVMDNDLVDSKGRWNYRAGFRMMKVGTTGTDENRKAIAGATTSESKPESKPANFKTSKDFLHNRPW